MIHLDFQSRVPIYQQLINAFTKLCVTGMLKPDEQLPSVRSLAGELGINPNTIQKAYQMLETQGTIYSIVGKGSFASAFSTRSPELLRRAEEKLRAAAREAAEVGLPEKEALAAVEAIYKEGKK